MTPIVHKPSAYERAQEFWQSRQQEASKALVIADTRLEHLHPPEQLSFDIGRVALVIPIKVS